MLLNLSHSLALKVKEAIVSQVVNVISSKDTARTDYSDEAVIVVGRIRQATVHVR